MDHRIVLLASEREHSRVRLRHGLWMPEPAAMSVHPRYPAPGGEIFFRLHRPILLTRQIALVWRGPRTKSPTRSERYLAGLRLSKVEFHRLHLPRWPFSRHAARLELLQLVRTTRHAQGRSVVASRPQQPLLRERHQGIPGGRRECRCWNHLRTGPAVSRSAAGAGWRAPRPQSVRLRQPVEL